MIVALIFCPSTVEETVAIPAEFAGVKVEVAKPFVSVGEAALTEPTPPVAPKVTGVVSGTFPPATLGI